MSSSPPTDVASRPARWRHPAGWSLRARMVLTLIGLLAVIGTAAGGPAEVSPRQQLYAGVDPRLDQALHPGRGNGDPNPKYTGGGFQRGNKGLPFPGSEL